MNEPGGAGIIRFSYGFLLTLVVAVFAGLFTVPFGGATGGFVVGLCIFMAGSVLSVAYVVFAWARDHERAVTGATAGAAIVVTAVLGMMLLLSKTSS